LDDHLKNVNVSFVFYIPSPQTVTRGWLFKHLLEEDQHALHSRELRDDQPILEGERLHHPGKSTRGISILRTEGQYEVTLHTLASKADWELAIHTAAVIAESAEERVQPENAKEMILHEFLQHCSADWIEEQMCKGVSELLRTIENTKAPVTVLGYRGRFSIGIELLKRLNLSSKSEREAYTVLVEKFTDIQNTLIAYQSPEQLMTDGSVGGKQEDMLIWIPQIATHLYKTVWVLVGNQQQEKGNHRLYKIRHEKLMQHLRSSPHATLADECNYFMDAYSDQETNELIAAIQSDVDRTLDSPAEQAKQETTSKKAWWKLW
jgi:hypothetical protein